MVRREHILIALTLGAAGCGLEAFEPTLRFDSGVAGDAGRSDGGARRDAGRRMDAGDLMDAGDIVDAGDVGDAGVDAGSDAGFDGALPDACPSFVEECNDRDDNCDGRVDEELTQACMNACGTMGVETCDRGVYGGCTAPAEPSETCNGMDDDCDGQIDEGAGCPCNQQMLGTHAYLFCTLDFSWTRARSECQRFGYELATIDDMVESDFVTNTALMVRDGDWWIGINDRAVEGLWVWDHGTSTFTNWDPGEPGDTDADRYDCGNIENGSAPWEGRRLWGDDDCFTRHSFVCESP